MEVIQPKHYKKDHLNDNANFDFIEWQGVPYGSCAFLDHYNVPLYFWDMLS